MKPSSHACIAVLVAVSTAAVPMWALAQAAGAAVAQSPAAAASTTGLTPIPLKNITLTDGFWKTRQETNRSRTVWANLEQCEKTGRLANFDEAAKYIKGDTTATNRGLLFNDSDVYKVLEGAAYILAAGPESPENGKLRQACDGIIKRIAAAQHADGYINTYHTVKEPQNRWKNIVHNHEMYCGGHLIEAGLAYFEATGDRTLLDIGVRFADHVDSIFGPGKRSAVPGHEEIEIALIKLWRQTGQKKYLDLASYFIEARGHTKGRETSGEYSQDHLPIREHDHIVGHAVRATYFYCAVADMAAINGDEGYIQAMDDVWFDLTQRKTYITGGIGPSAHNEGFTTPYDLPNDTAYAETCAGIASVMWNERLGRLHGDGKYFDAAERALYNGVLSGVSLSGDRFFYVNPLLSRGNHDRPAWYECACCPPNILRLIANVGTMFYSTRTSERGTTAIYVNLYNSSTARFDDLGLVIDQKTHYPWDGKVTMTISKAAGGAVSPSTTDLLARIPAWCRSATATVNGKAIELAREHGYAKLGSSWKTGDEIVLDFAMPIERISANPQVAADVGRVALQRGPVVYCLESSDNKDNVLAMALPLDAKLTSEFKADLLSGVSVIRGSAIAPEREAAVWKGELYRAAASGKPVMFTAIPYFSWNNRGKSSMTVWLPQSLDLLNTKVASPHAYTSSFRFRDEAADNIADGSAPKNSGDYDVPRLTFWPHKGTTEWAQVEYEKPRMVRSVEVYWFDDTGRGECRIPASWKVMYKDGEHWKEVPSASEYPVEKDTFCQVKFGPVRASGVRVEVQLQKEWSTGVLEWKVR